MLSCRMDPQNFDRYCRSCNRCNSESKGIYLFQEDLSASEWLVRELKTLVRERTPYSCADPEVYKNPDIRVLDKDGRLVCRIEAKVLDGKPFMKVHDLLKDSGLYPKETIVVDLPKLNHYIDRWREDGIVPTYLVWYLGRPCDDVGGITIFQDLAVLYKIMQEQGDKRSFKRSRGNGDMVDGRQLGITSKYHFSISECRPIEELWGLIV